MFVSVDGDGTSWKLGDIKMECLDQSDLITYVDGGAYTKNTIQFIDPVTSIIDNDKVYTYYGTVDGATKGDDDGWYTFPADNNANDEVFPAGTAFLCNFPYPEYKARLSYSGQVLKGDVVIDTMIDTGSGKSAVAYLYVANPIPTTITLADIKMLCNDGTGTFVDGGAYTKNTIQFIDPKTSIIDNDRVYTYYGTVDGATKGEDDGWYTFPADDFSNDVEMGVGDGFLCNFPYPQYEAKLVFKNPLQ